MDNHSDNNNYSTMDNHSDNSNQLRYNGQPLR